MLPAGPIQQPGSSEVLLCKGSAPVVLCLSLYTYASKLPTAAAGGGYTKSRVADELSLDNLGPELQGRKE